MSAKGIMRFLVLETHTWVECCPRCLWGVWAEIWRNEGQEFFAVFFAEETAYEGAVLQVYAYHTKQEASVVGVQSKRWRRTEDVFYLWSWDSEVYVRELQSHSKGSGTEEWWTEWFLEGLPLVFLGKMPSSSHIFPRKQGKLMLGKDSNDDLSKENAGCLETVTRGSDLIWESTSGVSLGEVIKLEKLGTGIEEIKKEGRASGRQNTYNNSVQTLTWSTRRTASQWRVTRAEPWAVASPHAVVAHSYAKQSPKFLVLIASPNYLSPECCTCWSPEQIWSCASTCMRSPSTELEAASAKHVCA